MSIILLPTIAKPDVASSGGQLINFTKNQKIMKLNYEHEISTREFTHLDSPQFREYLKRKTGDAFGAEIMKFTEMDELPVENHQVRFRAEIHVLPKSQYEHIIDLLKTLKGINPAVNDIVRQIANEL